MSVIAVILAGGVGARVGGAVPKQLMMLAGQTVLEHTVAAFAGCEAVDQVVVVMHPDHLDQARSLFAGSEVTVIAGGVLRHDSTHRALQSIDDDDAIVLIHDAARPLVTHEVIQRCVTALQEHAAVSTAVPVTDTVYRTGDARQVEAVVERGTLKRAQTPQGFHLSLIRGVHEAAQASGEQNFTDDCDIVLRFAPATPVVVVDGDERNFKITGPHDLAIAEALRSTPGR